MSTTQIKYIYYFYRCKSLATCSEDWRGGRGEGGGGYTASRFITPFKRALISHEFKSISKTINS